MIGKCIRCARAAYSERPDMYFCKARQGLVNETFARSHHDCFVPKGGDTATMLEDC